MIAKLLVLSLLLAFQGMGGKSGIGGNSGVGGGANATVIMGSNVLTGVVNDHPGNTVLIGGYFTSPCTCSSLTHVNVFSGNNGNSSYVFAVYPTSGGIADGQHPLASTAMTHTEPLGWDTGTISVSLTSGSLYFFALSGDNNFQAWRISGGSNAFAASTPYTGSAIDPMPSLTAQSFTYAMYLSQ